MNSPIDPIRRAPVRTDRGRGPVPKDGLAYLAGAQFGRLTFECELPSREMPRADGVRFVRQGRFRCSCGGSIDVELRNVKRGLTQSCGCIRKGSGT